jgi:hypothetical protein
MLQVRAIQDAASFSQPVTRDAISSYNFASSGTEAKTQNSR